MFFSNCSAVRHVPAHLVCCVCALLFFNLNIFAKEDNQEKKDNKIVETLKGFLNGFTIVDTHFFPYATLEDWFDPYVGLKFQHPPIWNSADKMNHHLKFEDARDYSWKFRYLANSLSSENQKLSFLFKFKLDQDAFFYGIGNSTELSKRAPAIYSSVFFGSEFRQSITDNVVFRWSPGFWKFKSGLVTGGEFEDANNAQYVSSRFTLSDRDSLNFLKAGFDNQWSAFVEIGLPVSSSVASYARFNLQSMTQFPLFLDSKFQIGTRFEFLISPDRDSVPYFAMPEIGSKNGLKGFSKERFRNFALLALNLEYIWPLTNKSHGFLLFDIGRTASNPTEFQEEESHLSLGLGVRLHSVNHPISIGIVGSPERFKLFSTVDVGSPW
ncbi:hypothetical protein IH992_07155 [Candidatus Poribacteria bacterium]|nr:hypothetical protein [Candidatus Poribacteria bacterium]